MTMARLIEAASIVDFDTEKMDLALLVGALANLQSWTASEPELKAQGKISICDRLRTEGQRLIDESMENDEPEGELILRIYRAASGQWAGTLFSDEIEIGGIAGCESAKAVENAARESGIYPDRIEVEPPPAFESQA